MTFKEREEESKGDRKAGRKVRREVEGGKKEGNIIILRIVSMKYSESVFILKHII